MATFAMTSSIGVRGYHVYRESQLAVITEVLKYRREPENRKRGLLVQGVIEIAFNKPKAVHTYISPFYT